MSEPTRDELNAQAEAAGVEDPAALPNKQAVADAIAAATEAPLRCFRLREDATHTFEDEEHPVHRVTFGASPRVSIGAGETYETRDAKLADRLAAHPHLEELAS